MLALFLLALAPEWPKHVIAEQIRTNTAIAADFTGDGCVDVIANDSTTRQDYLFIAPEWRRVSLNKGSNLIFSAAADADGDGDIDYIGAQYSPGYLYWLERPRDPLTEPWKLHRIDDAKDGGVDGIHGLAIADINADGSPDIVANSAQPNGKFANSLVWFEVPAGRRHVFAAGDAPGLSHYFGTGDVNGDGRIDIASAAKIVDGGNWFAWWAQPPEGAEPWTKMVIASGQDGASNILVTDVNGDGRQDFLASRGHGKGVIWFEAPGWTIRDIDSAIRYPHSLAAADLDGDGDVDAVACSAVYNKEPANPLLAWFENDGAGNFRTHLISNNQASYHVSLTDMDGDGDPDILVAGQESRNLVWYENRLKSAPPLATSVSRSASSCTARTRR